MKKIILFLFALLIINCIYAEPISGQILVGGILAHYETLQEAVNAITENGISGDIEILTNDQMTFNQALNIAGLNQEGIFNITINAKPQGLNRSTFVNDSANSWESNYIFKIENSKNIKITGARFEAIAS
ncbi:MAG: hypothetical protein KA886_07350, partial [Candidatus Cloacimonetes bacterium]|nr:hypothetical protein [Candidatus Cloacimonadota bacterium]